MRVHIRARQHGLAYTLRPHVGVHVAALLRHHKGGHQLFVADAVRKAHARAQNFGKTARVDNGTLGVHAFDGRHRPARDAQLPVGVVLQHGHAVPHRKRIHGPALGKAHGLARGVLEIGDAVEKARLFRRGKHGLQRGQVYARPAP